MLSFRNSTKLIAAAAVAVAISMPVRARDTSAGDHVRAALARPSSFHVTSPRSSTRADELAGSNHEGF
jgi:hypothetical protein